MGGVGWGGGRHPFCLSGGHKAAPALRRRPRMVADSRVVSSFLNQKPEISESVLETNTTTESLKKKKKHPLSLFFLYIN